MSLRPSLHLPRRSSSDVPRAPSPPIYLSPRQHSPPLPPVSAPIAISPRFCFISPSPPPSSPGVRHIELGGGGGRIADSAVFPRDDPNFPQPFLLVSRVVLIDQRLPSRRSINIHRDPLGAAFGGHFSSPSTISRVPPDGSRAGPACRRR